MAFTLAKLFGQQRPPAVAAPRNTFSISKPDGARAERKALVNQAVCEAMSAQGVLSSAYKRDIHLLDTPGQQARVYIDLAGELASLDAGRLGQHGAAIAKRVLDLCGTEVTAVYWRLNPAAVPLHATRTEAPVPVAAAAPVTSTRETAEQRLARLHQQVPDSTFEDSALPDFPKTVPGEMIDLHSVRRK